MKSILSLIGLVFLNSFLLVAQKSISKEDYEVLVDYANCSYVEAFIEKNDIGKPYFTDTYKKRIKPELEKVSLDNFESIIGYQRLLDLLSNNTPALELAKRINDRKLRYDEFYDDETLINSLSTTGWKNIDLSGIATDIQNKLIAKYSLPNRQANFNVSESQVVKTQTIQTSRQVEDLQQKFEMLQQQYENLKNETKIIDYQSAIIRLRITTYIIFGLILVSLLFVFLYFKRLTSRDLIIKQILESRRIEEKFARQVNGKQYRLSEKEINAIVDRVLECIQLNQKDNQPTPEFDNKGKPDPIKAVDKYLKGKTGKNFSRVESTPENSFFKLFAETGDTALFEFSGDEAEAIANRIFSEDICIIVSGGYQNAKTVIPHKPGKLKRVSDQWEVIERLEIKLV